MSAPPVEKSAQFLPSAKRLLSLMRPQRARLILVLILSVMSVVLNVLAPKILGDAIDAVFSGSVSQALPAGQTKDSAIDGLRASGDIKLADMVSQMDLVPGEGVDFGVVGRLLLMVLGLYLIAALAQFIQAWILNAAVQATIRKLRSDIEAKIHRVPLSYLDGRPRGELLSRVTNDVDNIAQSLTQTLSQLLVSLLTVIGVLVMMLTISPMLTVVVLVSIPVALLITQQVMKRSQKLFVQQWTSTGALNAQIEESFTGHELVTVFGRGKEVRERFDETNAELMQVSYKAQFISGLMMPIMMFVGNLLYVVVAVVGAVRVVNGQMTLGGVTAFVQYSRQFTQPLSQVASMTNLLQSGVASAERVFEVLDAPEQEPEKQDSLSSPTRGRVAFEDVAFGYGETPLINGLDLVAEPGQTVAIVGPTGAGKTTLVNLLMRFYELDRGRITLDGVDIAAVPRHELRSRIGMVLQDAWLFEGTIRENIAYGNPDATPEQIQQAAEATFVDRFVHSLPEGYDTVVDEEASNLSSGERQLVTIARAFVADPAMLVLDEATSSVDTRTELLLQEAMAALRSDRTSFVIAHRLSTIRDANLILVMEDGGIVEQGTHDELIRAEGAYYRLYQAQFLGAAVELDEETAAH
ncbi:ABC transporter ATP-binding protein [Demetria terragena]|uniref:ABC transporter ATP-binding protein n=1 Tax=Demetria terragena TaxID=63959 RepID=UPI00037A89BF|nr:ABC transporter ATP-binding protein [Demetria terragena]